VPAAKLSQEFANLETRAAKDFRSEAWLGKILQQRSVDIRYRGQGYELNLPYTRRLLERFHVEHKRRYGYSSPERDVEIVTVRMRGRVASPELAQSLLILQQSQARSDHLTGVVEAA